MVFTVFGMLYVVPGKLAGYEMRRVWALSISTPSTVAKCVLPSSTVILQSNSITECYDIYLLQRVFRELQRAERCISECRFAYGSHGKLNTVLHHVFGRNNVAHIKNIIRFD